LNLFSFLHSLSPVIMKQRSMYRYVHDAFIFVLVVFFIIPISIQLFNKFSLSLFVFRAGYGVIFLIMYYGISWLIIPVFIYLFRWSDRVLWLKSSLLLLIFLLISVALLSIKLNLWVVMDNEDIVSFTLFSSTAVFLWFIYAKNECVKPETEY